MECNHGGDGHANFNPRSPCGERLYQHIRLLIRQRFQSTLPVRGATDRVRSELEKASISIHAPRAGSDFEPGDFKTRFRFQSTLPVRGATGSQHLIFVRNQISIHAPRAGSDCRSQCAHVSDWRFQSTLPVRGATRVSLQTLEQGRRISIHAPRAGSDSGSAGADDSHSISIHAPRAGSDIMLGRPPPPMMHFNPRSPCGERQRRCPKRNRLF